MFCTGDIKTNNGTTVSGVCVSPPEMQKLEQLKKANPNASVTDLASQIYTTDGTTLSQALDKINEEINANGGPVSPSIPSILGEDFLNQMLNQSKNKQYQSTKTSSSSGGLLSSPFFIIFLFLIVFLLWQSEPTTSGNKMSEAKAARTYHRSI